MFAQLRDKASGGTSEAAEQEYERGVALYEAGQVTDGIRALEAASRSPIHRFRAAAALGRIYRDRGALSQAIEWFERGRGSGAEREDGHALFYELAVSLEFHLAKWNARSPSVSNCRLRAATIATCRRASAV